MQYEECVKYLEARLGQTGKPTLFRMQAFMQELGNPQNNVPALHIAGTNGKGSTTAILDSIANTAGLACGRFTGPHILRWNERFSYQGQTISDHDFAELFTQILAASGSFAKRNSALGELSWFEILTAMAFLFFAEKKADLQILEVGLGGKFDATNVIDRPEATAIVTVDLDHTHLLGNTLSAIAAEKAGVIKPDIPCVTGAGKEALAVIRTYCQHLNAPLIVVDKTTFPAKITSQAAPFASMDRICKQSNRLSEQYTQLIRDSAPWLKAPYQQNNILVTASLAAICDQNNKLAQKLLPHFQAGLKSASWPGRMQFIPGLNLLLDGAHNPAAALALKEALDTCHPHKRRKFVIGAYQSKNVADFLANLLGPEDEVFCAASTSWRASHSSEHIQHLCRQLGNSAFDCGTFNRAIEAALARVTEEDLVVITGSFAAVKAALQYLCRDAIQAGYNPETISATI